MSFAFLDDYLPLTDDQVDALDTCVTKGDWVFWSNVWGRSGRRAVTCLLLTVRRLQELLRSQEELLDARRQEIQDLRAALESTRAERVDRD